MSQKNFPYSSQNKDLKNVLGNLYVENQMRLLCMSFLGTDFKHKFLQCFSQLVTTNKIPEEDKPILKTLHLQAVLPKTVHGNSKKITAKGTRWWCSVLKLQHLLKAQTIISVRWYKWYNCGVLRP